MKKHQVVAIVVSTILSLVSFLPVFITMEKGYELAHPGVIGVFLYPTIGVAVAAVIIFIAFLIDKNE